MQIVFGLYLEDNHSFTFTNQCNKNRLILVISLILSFQILKATDSSVSRMVEFWTDDIRALTGVQRALRLTLSGEISEKPS